jgi:hypothetical protein
MYTHRTALNSIGTSHRLVRARGLLPLVHGVCVHTQLYPCAAGNATNFANTSIFMLKTLYETAV